MVVDPHFARAWARWPTRDAWFNRCRSFHLHTLLVCLPRIACDGFQAIKPNESGYLVSGCHARDGTGDPMGGSFDKFRSFPSTSSARGRVFRIRDLDDPA